LKYLGLKCVAIFSVFPSGHEFDVDCDGVEEHEGAEAADELASAGWKDHERRFLRGQILLNLCRTSPSDPLLLPHRKAHS